MRTKKELQKTIIIKQLKRYKRVTRNWALKNHITRLSAYICQLRKEGWDFETPDHRADSEFRYLVIKEPKKLSTDKRKK